MPEMLNSDGCGVPEYHRHSRLKGKPLSPEHRAKISAALKRKPPSAETRAKMSVAKSGENHPLFGKHHTPETRARMSASKRGKLKSPDTRAKMSAAANEREARKRVQLSTTIIFSSR
jgi:hypothetical protein